MFFINSSAFLHLGNEDLSLCRGLRGRRGDYTASKGSAARFDAPQRGPSRSSRPTECSNHSPETHAQRRSVRRSARDADPGTRRRGIPSRGRDCPIQLQPRRREVLWSTVPRRLTGDMRWPPTTRSRWRGGDAGIERFPAEQVGDSVRVEATGSGCATNQRRCRGKLESDTT